MSPAPLGQRQGREQTSTGDALIDAISTLGDGEQNRLSYLLGPEVRWSWKGTLSRTRTFVGRDSAIDELLAGVDATVDAQQGVSVRPVVADESRVVVEFSGRNSAPAEARYDNRDCGFASFTGAHLVELHEWLEVEAVTSVSGSAPLPSYRVTELPSYRSRADGHAKAGPGRVSGQRIRSSRIAIGRQVSSLAPAIECCRREQGVHCGRTLGNQGRV